MAGLFVFYFFSTSVNQGAKSVVGGGRLILNTAFPRTLLPLSSVVTAFMRFLPTLAIYAVMHAVAGLPVGPHLLWAIPIFAMIAVFASGVALLFAAAQVYFRDLSSFLPYVTRIWLYASPILYYVDQVPERFKPILALNPLYPLLASWSDVINLGQQPSGMYGRLAFAVAVHMDPDILLIDEALSVGDARFKRKSFDKMRELCGDARTIVLVTHALGSVRELCNEALWLHQGRLAMCDDADTVVEAYTRFLDVGETGEVLEDV